MYVDLTLSETGDLSFEEKPVDLQPQKIKFNLSNTKAQKICFAFQNIETVKHNSNNYLKVEFVIDKSKPNIIASICSDDIAKAQLITLKLKTCLGDLPERLSFGAKLSSFKHENINSSTLISLEKYLESILADDIFAVSVKATPVIDYNNGYKQTVQLDIFSNQQLLLDYKIER